MKTTLQLIASLFLCITTLFASDEIEIFSSSEQSANGEEIQTKVSISRERLNALPKTNLFIEDIPVSAQEAIALSAKAFQDQDPLIKRTVVQKIELLQAVGPDIENQNFFVGVPLYAVEIHGFRSEDQSPQTYIQKFVVLPDKSVEMPIAKK